MTQISFEYKGRKHSGHIISSTNLEPHYHWVYFNDSEMQELLNDDCIGFKKTTAGLKPTKIYTTHTDLVEVLREAIEELVS